MDIKYQKKNHFVNASQIKPGDPFMWLGSYMMRLNWDSPKDHIEAVYLESGHVESVHVDEKVIPVCAKIVVEEE